MEENYSLGAVRSNIDVRNYRLDSSAVKGQTFPKQFALKMPAVKNQGRINSCVAHAMATIVEYFNMVQTKDLEPMSTGFFYGNRENTVIQTQGMMLHKVLDSARIDGDVKYADFPHNVEMPQAKELFDQYYPALKEKAAPYKITGYYYCPTKDSIKAALMKDGPVLMAMIWRKDTKLADDGYTLTTKSGLCNITGGHCMVIYGWNEKGWLVQNSWGENWGKKGTCLIPYNVSILETWGVIDTNIDNRTDLTKPFSSQVGRAVAKVLNSVLNLFKKKS